MAVITMPALSPTMTEGKLARWLVKEGDEVRSGDVIAEIETDKALMEVEALEDGTVNRIMAAEGEEAVAVGAPIAEILGDDETPADIAAAPVIDTKQAEPPPVAAAPVAQAPARQPEKQQGTRLIASPLAKRLAAENNIDLTLIKGSGPHGRIVLADINALVEGGASCHRSGTCPNCSCGETGC